MRDSERAELGEDDMLILEQSDPRRPPRSCRLPSIRSTAAPSSSRFTTAATAVVGEGSGADSSCCKKESMSSNGRGESGSAESSCRKRKGGWDGIAVGVAGESDSSQGGE